MPKDSNINGLTGRQTFLFLQGPLCPFFPALAEALEQRGHRTLRVNLCFGDWLLWRRADAVNYRGTFRGWPAFIARLVAKERVTDLVLVGEQRPYHRVAMAAVSGRGGRVHVTDLGYLRPDWITLEPDGMTGESRFPRDPEGIRRLAADAPPVSLKPQYYESFPTQARWDVIYHLASWLLRPLYPFYVSHQIYHPVPNYLGTGWRLLRKKHNAARAQRVIAECVASKRPMWLLPMQMEVDYQLRAYSRFPGMTAVIDETLGSFARSAPAEDLMIVKIHPLDPGLRPWRKIVGNIAKRYGLEDRVVFIDGGILEEILAVVKGVVTVNSTVGLTALMLGKPVIALGQAVYDVAGLTFQSRLDAFWHDFAPPDSKLFDAYIRAMTDTILVRGTYYADPGMSAAVIGAADRLMAPVASHIKARLLAASARLPAVTLAAGVAD